MSWSAKDRQDCQYHHNLFCHLKTNNGLNNEIPSSKNNILNLSHIAITAFDYLVKTNKNTEDLSDIEYSLMTMRGRLLKVYGHNSLIPSFDIFFLNQWCLNMLDLLPLDLENNPIQIKWLNQPIEKNKTIKNIKKSVKHL